MLEKFNISEKYLALATASKISEALPEADFRLF
jgi:hypothetical protein